MAQRYPTPRALVEALQERGDGARSQFQELLRSPLAHLMEKLRGRHNLHRKGESLTQQALHTAETHLRTRPPHLFSSLTWPAFRAGVVLHVAKLASQPYGQRAGAAMSPGALPESRCYQSESLFLPYERVGDYWFGGDWFGGLEDDGGSMWVLLADITGHGYFAYLLASTLPGVWRTCWQSKPATPADLLASMHKLLADCLPEGVYVECTLVRLHPDGRAIVAPAGGSRLLLCRASQERPILLKLRGTWLGLAPPSAGDQHTCTLEDSDELLLATDGMFDQLHEQDADLADLLDRGDQDGGLFERVHTLLRQALEKTPQKDDITVVMLRRRSGVPEASAPLPYVDLSSPNEAGDVPV